jgi:hypothetical protein
LNQPTRSEATQGGPGSGVQADGGVHSGETVAPVSLTQANALIAGGSAAKVDDAYVSGYLGPVSLAANAVHHLAGEAQKLETSMPQDGAMGVLRQGVGFTAASLNLVDIADRSFLYSAIQQPISGVSQLVNHVAGGEVLPEVKLVAPPPEAKFGTAEWWASTIGMGAGMAVPFMMTDGAVGLATGIGKAESLPLAARFIRPMSMAVEDLPLATRMASMGGRAALSGSIYGLVFTPSREDGDFWTQRGINSLTTGLTFGVQATAATGLLRGFEAAGFGVEQGGARAITGRLGSNIMSGGFAGLINAEGTSLLNGRGFADADSVYQDVVGFAATGGVLDAMHIAGEKIVGRMQGQRGSTASTGSSEGLPISPEDGARVAMGSHDARLTRSGPQSVVPPLSIEDAARVSMAPADGSVHFADELAPAANMVTAYRDVPVGAGVGDMRMQYVEPSARAGDTTQTATPRHVTWNELARLVDNAKPEDGVIVTSSGGKWSRVNLNGHEFWSNGDVWYQRTPAGDFTWTGVQSNRPSVWRDTEGVLRHLDAKTGRWTNADGSAHDGGERGLLPVYDAKQGVVEVPAGADGLVAAGRDVLTPREVWTRDMLQRQYGIDVAQLTDHLRERLSPFDNVEAGRKALTAWHNARSDFLKSLSSYQATLSELPPQWRELAQQTGGYNTPEKFLRQLRTRQSSMPADQRLDPATMDKVFRSGNEAIASRNRYADTFNEAREIADTKLKVLQRAFDDYNGQKTVPRFSVSASQALGTADAAYSAGNMRVSLDFLLRADADSLAAVVSHESLHNVQRYRVIQNLADQQGITVGAKDIPKTLWTLTGSEPAVIIDKLGLMDFSRRALRGPDYKGPLSTDELKFMLDALRQRDGQSLDTEQRHVANALDRSLHDPNRPDVLGLGRDIGVIDSEIQKLQLPNAEYEAGRILANATSDSGYAQRFGARPENAEAGAIWDQQRAEFLQLAERWQRSHPTNGASEQTAVWAPRDTEALENMLSQRRQSLSRQLDADYPRYRRQLHEKHAFDAQKVSLLQSQRRSIMEQASPGPLGSVRLDGPALGGLEGLPPIESSLAAEPSFGFDRSSPFDPLSALDSQTAFDAPSDASLNESVAAQVSRYDRFAKSVVRELQSGPRPSDREQANVYKVLNNSLENTGLAKQGWRIFPTQTYSALDSVKGDYVMVNENTGKTFLLDVTARAQEKLAKFQLPPFAEIIDTSNVKFDFGDIEPDHPFNADVNGILRDIAARQADGLDIATTPLPDFLRGTPDEMGAQLEKFSRWLRAEMAQMPASQRRAYMDYADHIDNARRSLTYSKVESKSTTMRDAAGTAARKAIIDWLTDTKPPRPDPHSGPAPEDPPFEVYVKNDELKVRVFGDDGTREPIAVFSAGMLPDILRAGRLEVLSADARNGGWAQKYAKKNSPAELERIKRGATDRTNEIIAGGRRGAGPPDITNAILDALRNRSLRSLIGDDAYRQLVPGAIPEQPAGVPPAAAEPAATEYVASEVPSADKVLTDLKPKLGNQQQEQIWTSLWTRAREVLSEMEIEQPTRDDAIAALQMASSELPFSKTDRQFADVLLSHIESDTSGQK